MNAPQAYRYILMPERGSDSGDLTSDRLQALAGPLLKQGLGTRHLGAAPSVASASPPGLVILDKLREGGPMLVEVDRTAEAAVIEARRSGIRLVPVVPYAQMRAGPVVTHSAQGTSPKPGSGVGLIVVDAGTGKGVAGATVLLFTNLAKEEGVKAVTDAAGRARLGVKPGARVERLYVYGPAGYWGHLSGRQKAGQRQTVAIKPIDLASRDLVLRRLYGARTLQDGAGIRVAVIDSGIARDHPCLPNVTGGANLVLDETLKDPKAGAVWWPVAPDDTHGTHVAGILGARPAPGIALSGLAPGVELRSYRVFPGDGRKAMNYDIMKAIDRAVADGCVVINLSLGSATQDDAVAEAIAAANRAGALVVAAGGNQHRSPVSYPAALQDCVAVAAMGVRRTFPGTSTEKADIAEPYGTDPREFVAAFSNAGQEIDLIAPGVGVVSTLPGGGFGPMSGTSMACPVVSAAAARLLGADPELQRCVPSRRVALWKAKLTGSAASKGFGRNHEGAGLVS